MSQLSTANTTPQRSDKDQAQEAFKNFQKDIQLEKFKNTQQRVLKQGPQLDRLTQEKFRNPFDVLLLDISATEEEIKKQYRQFSLICHPDRCKDPRAKDAFFIVESAYKTLQDEQKRKVYLRIMREAKEKTEFERNKENRKREKQGQAPLPQDTFDSDYKKNLEEIFDQIEEKKLHMAKLKESEQKAKQEEMEKKGLLQQYKIYTDDEWELTREKRVDNWRKFSGKKSIIGTKSSNKGIKAPNLKQEARPSYAPKIDNKGKIIGIDEDYKKKWK